MKKATLYRGLFYILGLLVLALGLTLNTKTGLGVSPIISVAYSTSEIFHQNFGDMTLALYTLFVAVEMILHLIREKEERKSTKSFNSCRKAQSKAGTADGFSPDSPEPYFYQISEFVPGLSAGFVFR